MFDCADSILTERLLKRAETSDRNDDNEETIKKRLALFHEKTMPVVEHYNKKAKLVSAVDKRVFLSASLSDLRAFMDTQNVT